MFPELFENTKIVIKDIIGRNGIVAALDDQRYYCEHTLSICIKKELIKATSKRNFDFPANELKLSEQYDDKLILALLNSKLISFYFMNFLSDGLHCYPNDLKNIPLPQLKNEKESMRLQKLISNLLEALVMQRIKMLQHIIN